MTYSPLNDNYVSQLETWERTPSYAPTPGDFGRACTPPEYSPSPSHTSGNRSPAFSQSQPGQIGDLHELDWDNGSIYYVIEWRVTLNKRILTKDTEEDLDLKPSSYWQKIRDKAEDLVHRKKARDQRVRPDDTTVEISINERSQRRITKRFEATDIDWTSIERQLQRWKTLCGQGKIPMLSISINYLVDSNSRANQRGSATTRMLREREVRLHAECSSGQASPWRHVYQVMRCPGRPCHHNGQFCWLDPAGRKHYKLLQHHMRSIIEHVEKGGILETQDDVPYDVREMLYAEEERNRERRQKATNTTTGSGGAPINIHVLPTQPSLPSLSSPDNNEKSSPPIIKPDYIDIPGPYEVAVEEYTSWQLLKVSTENFREHIRKARDVALENCLDLGQILHDRDPDFFFQRGVAIGVARRFVGDIRRWFDSRKPDDESDSITLRFLYLRKSHTLEFSQKPVFIKAA